MVWGQWCVEFTSWLLHHDNDVNEAVSSQPSVTWYKSVNQKIGIRTVYESWIIIFIITEFFLASSNTLKHKGNEDGIVVETLSPPSDLVRFYLGVALWCHVWVEFVVDFRLALRVFFGFSGFGFFGFVLFGVLTCLKTSRTDKVSSRNSVILRCYFQG